MDCPVDRFLKWCAEWYCANPSENLSVRGRLVVGKLSSKVSVKLLTKLSANLAAKMGSNMSSKLSTTSWTALWTDF